MKKIAVTGAGGFIGSHICKRLKELGYFVKAISIEDVNHNDYDIFLKADLRNQQTISHAFKDIDYVFHFAADMGGVGYFSVEQYEPTMNNFLSDLHVMQFCEQKGIGLFYPSSACIYPTYLMEQGKLLSEKMINEPASPDQMYGWEKLSITKIAKFSKHTRVGILHTIFGEGQEYQGKKAKFPPQITYKVIQAIKNKTLIEVWGNGQQERTFQYIDDAVEKIIEIAFADKYLGPVNISSDEIVTVQQCIDWLQEYAGTNIECVYDLTKPSGVQIRRVDNSLFKSIYQYRDKTTTKQGFTKLFDWISKSC